MAYPDSSGPHVRGASSGCFLCRPLLEQGACHAACAGMNWRKRTAPRAVKRFVKWPFGPRVKLTAAAVAFLHGALRMLFGILIE
ncbi:hypothetical protein AWB81_02425 [Caballeronia arationis]|nr:hypothetical protein AWB81_02425 [Caballeronia arationis]